MEPATAPAAGLLGPDEDTESLVLGLLNRNDRGVLRRTSQARRRDLGARTTTLVLSDEQEGDSPLASLDLASSFPGRAHAGAALPT